MCVCCCVFLYNTIIMIPITEKTDKDTNSISRIVITKIITTNEGTVSGVVVVVVVGVGVWTGVYSRL